MKKQLTLLLSFCTALAFAQNIENIGFESGNTTNWTCSSGTFGDKNPPKCNGELPVTLTAGNCQNQGGLDGTATPANLSENRHIIMSQKNVKDPNSNNTVGVVAPPNMFPGSVNNYSFRIGNAVGGDATNPNGLAYAESIKYKFVVDKNNAGLTYMYAAFVKEQIPEVHPINMSPSFEIKLTDGAGNLIPCGQYMVKAGQTNGFKDGASDQNGIWKYTDWTKVALDLSGYIGQSVTIEFRTHDCFPSTPSFVNNGGKVDTICNAWIPGSHSAYAYIDLYGTPVEIISPPVCANLQTIQLCGPAGYATYEWPANQPGLMPPFNKQCVTVNLPKAGDKYTVNMTSIAGGCPTSTSIILKGADFTISDTTICPNAPVKLKITTVVAGNYDFKWEPATNLDNPKIQNPTFTPGATTTYTVTMADKIIANCNQVKKVTITVLDATKAEAKDTAIRPGETAVLNGKVSNNKSGYWEGGQGIFTPDRSTLNATYKPTVAEENAGYVYLTLKVIDTTVQACPPVNALMKLTISPFSGILTFNQNNVSVEVFPNPFNTVLNINASGLTNSASTELKLFDYAGKEVRSIQLKNGLQKLDRNNLASGIYLMQVVDKGIVLQKKKIVIND